MGSVQELLFDVNSDLTDSKVKELFAQLLGLTLTLTLTLMDAWTPFLSSFKNRFSDGCNIVQLLGIPAWNIPDAEVGHLAS
jgi:hypothetical protein